MSNKFYAVQQHGRSADLVIFGPIRSYKYADSDVTAWSIHQDLKQLDADEIHVRINCPGGNVGEGFAIYNTLREHKAKIVTHADGYVASAAIFPFLAGDRRIANPVSAFYFHKVQMPAYGGPEELRKVADQAEMLTEQGVKAFEAAGVPVEKARELLARDDFATPEEMLELGIATELGQKDTAQEAQQSILPMISQLLREHRAGKTEGSGAEKTPPEPQEGPENKLPEGMTEDPAPAKENRLRALLGIKPAAG